MDPVTREINSAERREVYTPKGKLRLTVPKTNKRLLGVCSMLVILGQKRLRGSVSMEELHLRKGS